MTAAQARSARSVLLVPMALLVAGCATPAGPHDAAASARQASQRACARADWFASRPSRPAADAAAPVVASGGATRADPGGATRADPAGPRRAGPPDPSGPPAIVGFSAQAVEVADAIGALPMLRQISELEASAASDRDAALALLRARQALTEQILLASLEVSGVLAEVGCESERGNQLRDRLQRAEEDRTRRLSLASIFIGAATAILSGGLALAHPQSTAGSVVGTVGGTAEAGAGLALQLGSRTAELQTERNLLREVWEGPERSALFPPLVWRFLSSPVRGDAAGRTVRTKLIDEWRADGRLGEPGSQAERDRIALLLGARGRFAVEDLLVRDAMLDLLQSDVALIHQDLELLLRELMARPLR